MRRSRAEAAETRERILDTASRLFREKGIDGLGVAELMQRAGLTHGGFYRHFASKDALVAEACAAGLRQTRDSLTETASRAPEGKALERILKAYLSTEHRDHPEGGCTIAALGGEAARADRSAREAVTGGVEDLIAIVADALDEPDPERRRASAAAIVSAMVGGLLVARAVSDPQLSERILRDTRSFLLEQAG